jgi:hypothetical protein
MGISFPNKKEEKKERLPEFPAEETTPLLATITQSIGLKFSNGYEFKISYENKKMIVSASMNGQEAFYLDEIPEEFIEGLRRVLK